MLKNDQYLQLGKLKFVNLKPWKTLLVKNKGLNCNEIKQVTICDFFIKQHRIQYSVNHRKLSTIVTIP